MIKTDYTKISDYENRPDNKYLNSLHDDLIKLLNKGSPKVVIELSKETVAKLIDLTKKEQIQYVQYDKNKSNTKCPACGENNHLWYRYCKECGQRIGVTDGNGNIMYGA